MMLRIREAEGTQAMGDLRQTIAELEIRVSSIEATSLSMFIFVSRIRN